MTPFKTPERKSLRRSGSRSPVLGPNCFWSESDDAAPGCQVPEGTRVAVCFHDILMEETGLVDMTPLCQCEFCKTQPSFPLSGHQPCPQCASGRGEVLSHLRNSLERTGFMKSCLLWILNLRHGDPGARRTEPHLQQKLPELSLAVSSFLFCSHRMPELGGPSATRDKDSSSWPVCI